METQLRDALALEQLEVYCQPQYDMRDHSLVGAKALLRWNHTDRSMGADAGVPTKPPVDG